MEVRSRDEEDRGGYVMGQSGEVMGNGLWTGDEGRFKAVGSKRWVREGDEKGERAWCGKMGEGRSRGRAGA